MKSENSLNQYCRMINKNNLMKLSKVQLADILLGLMNTVESLLQTEDSSQNIIPPTPEFCDDYRPNIQLIKLLNEKLLKTIGQWLSEGSGWSIEEIFAHELLVAKYVPLKDSSYIKLPLK